MLFGGFRWQSVLLVHSDVFNLKMLLLSFPDTCIQLGMAFLGLPGIRPAGAEHFLDFFESFATCFGVARVKPASIET